MYQLNRLLLIIFSLTLALNANAISFKKSSGKSRSIDGIHSMTFLTHYDYPIGVDVEFARGVGNGNSCYIYGRDSAVMMIQNGDVYELLSPEPSYAIPGPSCMAVTYSANGVSVVDKFSLFWDNVYHRFTGTNPSDVIIDLRQ